MTNLKRLLQAKRNETRLLVTPRFEEYLARTANILVDEAVGDFVKQALTTPQRYRRMTFSASGMGACPRERVFQFTPLKPVLRLNSDLHARFHEGTWSHMKWQALLLDAGVLSWVEVDCSWQAKNLTGTIDGIGLVPEELQDDHDWGSSTLTDQPAFGWELKTANDRNFKWVCQRGPGREHLLQIHAYMLATGLRVWSLIYENKNDQTWKEFLVRFDPDIARDVEYELQYLNEHVEKRVLPPVLDDCKVKKGPFKRCAFAHVCLGTQEWPQRVLKMRKVGDV